MQNSLNLTCAAYKCPKFVASGSIMSWVYFLKLCRKQNIHLSPNKHWTGLCAVSWAAPKRNLMMPQGNLSEQLLLILICTKADQWAAAVVVKPSQIWQHQQKWDLGTLVSLLGVLPKKRCFVGRASASPSLESLLQPIVLHLSFFESQNMAHVTCLISTIAVHGATSFWSNKSPKNYGLSKTSPKTEKQIKCIGMYTGMYNTFFSDLYLYYCIAFFFRVSHVWLQLFSRYACITRFFHPMHSDTCLCILRFPCFLTLLWVNVCVFHHSVDEVWTAFFKHRLSEIKIANLESQPTAYLPFLFVLLPLWPIWNFFPSLPCWS